MGQATVSNISALEVSRLGELETVIAHGIKTFVDVGNALKEIRDSRLYREEHATFEAYCRERWGFVKTYANYMIQSAEVVRELRDNNCCQIPATESQARELSRIKEPERRAEVWQKVTETHEPVEITAKVIREAAEEERREPVPAEPRQPFTQAMMFATMAISQLERIHRGDPERLRAFEKVKDWIEREKAK